MADLGPRACPLPVTYHLPWEVPSPSLTGGPYRGWVMTSMAIPAGSPQSTFKILLLFTSELLRVQGTGSWSPVHR